MHAGVDAVQRPTFTGTPLQVVLHDQAAVLANAQKLGYRERTAFASIVVQIVLHGFAGELAVLEAENVLTGERAA
jgi:hypothetical protein